MSTSLPSFVGDASQATYEGMLSANVRWALDEGSLFFDGKGRVHEALRKITRRLDELNIPYAVVGGMALFFHGYRRFTEDVDLLVTPEALTVIHEQLEGRGYLPPFEKSKHLRDTDLKVKVEFLTTGGFPGDGKPKPVAFPNPSDVSVTIDGLKVLTIPSVVELKLASGMSNVHRRKDLVDVQQLITALRLPRNLGEALNEYVRPTFLQLWDEINSPQRFILLHRKTNKTANAISFDDLIRDEADSAAMFQAMKADGVEFSAEPGGEYFKFVVNDPQIAAKYDMHEESEFRD